MLLIALTVIAIGHRYIYIYLYYDIIYLCAYIVILNTFFFSEIQKKKRLFFGWMLLFFICVSYLTTFRKLIWFFFWFLFFSCLSCSLKSSYNKSECHSWSITAFIFFVLLPWLSLFSWELPLCSSSLASSLWCNALDLFGSSCTS